MEDKFHYTIWRSADLIQQNVNSWISEIEFILVEHTFFKDWLNHYKTETLSQELAQQTISLKAEIKTQHIQLENLLEQLRKHHDAIAILTNFKDELEQEKLLQHEHQILQKKMFLKKNMSGDLKKEIFTLLRTIKKLKNED